MSAALKIARGAVFHLDAHIQHEVAGHAQGLLLPEARAARGGCGTLPLIAQNLHRVVFVIQAHAQDHGAFRGQHAAMSFAMRTAIPVWQSGLGLGVGSRKHQCCEQAEKHGAAHRCSSVETPALITQPARTAQAFPQ